jgi:hypothetical protein
MLSPHHASQFARGADALAFPGVGDEVVVPAVITPCAGKAVGEDTAFEVFSKGLAHIGSRGVVVALAVELRCTGKCHVSKCAAIVL